MKLTEQISSNPISVQKTLRSDFKRCLTSCYAGKVVPLAYTPLLREDSVTGRFRVRVEMQETVEMLMNSINVTVYAHFIPFLAFERFNGMDQFNRSYAGIPEVEGQPPIPFFKTERFPQTAPIYRAMGIAHKAGAQINTALVEAYNVLINYRRNARSTKLPLRVPYDPTLAEAFWRHPNMSHIVPDFDEAMMDVEIPLMINGNLPVRGIGPISYAATPHSNDGKVMDGRSPPKSNNYTVPLKVNADGSQHGIGVVKSAITGLPDIFAELKAQNITLSLSNIDLARKTVAFAKLREQYSGRSDEYIIDLLMQGVRVPEESLKDPILLDRKTTLIGYSRRYATDGANLTESVTSGETFVDLRFRLPPTNTGGIVLITCEIVPEQLFERQKDYFLSATSVNDLPNFTRDFLGPQKVAVVQNSHVDVDHNDPLGTFGYAPLNHQWKRNAPNIGGKYYRPTANAVFDENRQKIWSVEIPNPRLTNDFYLVGDIHHRVFHDTEQEPFEIATIGEFSIVGNTVFGKGLQEDTDTYEAVSDLIDHSRINPPEV